MASSLLPLVCSVFGGWKAGLVRTCINGDADNTGEVEA